VYDSGKIAFIDMLVNWGDKILINGYGTLFIPSRTISGSRSGSAIQIKSDKANSLIRRVPPQYSGVPADNILTRALNTTQFIDSLSNILSTIIQRD
jgi:hypothetical protein